MLAQAKWSKRNTTDPTRRWERLGIIVNFEMKETISDKATEADNPYTKKDVYVQLFY